MYYVNATGMQEIRKFLAANHKLGGDHFTDVMLHAWASAAEYQAAEGNPPSIEIKSADAIDGHAIEYTISPEGLNWMSDA